MLIPTYYLLSKIWDIFATRRRILLEINKNYFRGGEMTPIGKDITKCNEIACSSGELHAISFLCPHVCYLLILPFFTAFLLHEQIVLARIRIILKSRCFPNWRCLLLFDHLSEGIRIFLIVSDK